MLNKILICLFLWSVFLNPVKGQDITLLEPNWIKYPPQKGVNLSLGWVLADIESHLPAQHPYKTTEFSEKYPHDRLEKPTGTQEDLVTWSHEGTHGINSHIRSKYSNMGKINAFYCLKDRAVVLKEPSTTLATIAQNVPVSLRGDVYELYLIKSRQYWNNEPLYIFDEWIAYTNGTHAGLVLATEQKWNGGPRYDTVLYMLEFNIYSLSLIRQLTGNSPNNKNYDNSTDFKAFMRWQLERTMQLYKKSQNFVDFKDRGQEEYLKKFRKNSDSKKLREFTKTYFGERWAKRILGL